MRCEHEYEVLDVIQVVGWSDNDIAVPCILEVNQCSKCGMVDESVDEGSLEFENESEFDWQ